MFAQLKRVIALVVVGPTAVGSEGTKIKSYMSQNKAGEVDQGYRVNYYSIRIRKLNAIV